uniref:H/ACA ribonucleoprotein complex non-core subunit NAF1 n=1 Tax=Kalanchoe fedtschenkoi TaxID=63787 RepID=A0A7N0UKJ4_KALFE
MVEFHSDSLDTDEGTELKVSADCTVPSISDLDFSSPLFDSLPDFETLKEYWLCESPCEEIFGYGKGSFLGFEEDTDMIKSESGAGTTQPEADNENLAVPAEGIGKSDGTVANDKSERLSIDGEEAEMSGVNENGDSKNVMNVELEDLEAGKGLYPGGLHVGRSEVGENGTLGEVKNFPKTEVEGSESLSPTIEADMRKVSLDEPANMSVNAGVPGEEDESESSDDSNSESESSLSEASSSATSSSSDDDGDEEGGILRRNAELDGMIEEGEIVDEEVEQMVAWSDDDDEVVKGPIRSKNEITDLPPVPKIDVTLNPNHQVFPIGVVLSIVGKQVIVEGVEKHNPLNEGSILWITESRLPLGLVDDTFGPVKNPYYAIRYNDEDEVPPGITVGTPVSYVPEFVNHVLNDASLYKKGYDASNENDEELSEEAEFSDDEKEAEYRRMLKISKRGSNEEPGGKRKKDRRKNKTQERKWNNQRSSPQPNSCEGDLPASHNSEHLSATETHGNQKNKFPGGGQSFSLPPGMAVPFQHTPHPSSFNLGSNGVWQNGMPIPQQQQPLFFPSAFPTNGVPWMQQNSLVRNPFNLLMPMPQGMPFTQQFGSHQMLPPNFVVPGGQQIFMGSSSNSPFPGFFGHNNFNQGNGQIMATSVPGAPLTNVASTDQNGAIQPPANIPGSTDNGRQVRSDMPSGGGRNQNSQWRGRTGSRGGRFGRGRGSGGRGRGRHQVN